MKDKVYRMLRDATGLPAMFLQRPSEFPSLTYHFYGMGGRLFGEGSAVGTGGPGRVSAGGRVGHMRCGRGG